MSLVYVESRQGHAYLPSRVIPELNFRGHLSFAFATAWSLAAIPKMALSVGFRIPVSLLILLPCYGASTSTPVGLSPTGRASLCWTHISIFCVNWDCIKGGGETG
jgi:hypothetical protein